MSLDLTRFHKTFFDESFEQLDAMEGVLLQPNISQIEAEAINELFRAAHSIKGGGATFGFDILAQFAHHVETLMDQVRKKNCALNAEVVDVLIDSVDCMRSLLTTLSQGNDPEEASVRRATESIVNLGSNNDDLPGTLDATTGTLDATTGTTFWHIEFKTSPTVFKRGIDPGLFLRELQSLGKVEVRLDDSNLPTFSTIDPETSYLGWDIQLEGSISRSMIDDIFEWVYDDSTILVEQLSASENDADLTAAELAHLQDVPGATGQETSIRIDVAKIDTVINLVGEMVINTSMLNRLANSDDENEADLFDRCLVEFESNMRQLQEGVMQMRMLPISYCFQRLPRLVRDLSRSLEKEVHLTIEGEATEVDKSMLEKLTDPLVHLVRNAIDHGIEPANERKSNGKPNVGQVQVSAYHASGTVVVEVTDDGRGFDFEAIRTKAANLGLFEGDSPPTEEEVRNFIFRPGLSTSTELTDVSGRGVGMDVVKSNIEELGGNIEVESQPGQGSKIRISVPLTLAILDGQLLEIGSSTLIVPLVNVVESLQLTSANSTNIGNRPFLRLRGDVLPVIDLSASWGPRTTDDGQAHSLAVIVEYNHKRVALLVDRLSDQRQVVIKNLEENFVNVPGFSSATILGDGTVGLILDVASIVNMRAASADVTRSHSTAIA